MEERLRQYFRNKGFYVVRGIKFIYDSFDITDVDLWLYNKTSDITRERIIVDIKNKKTPQAIERIFWTRGLLTALRVNSCMVATSEKRESIRNFGKLNGVTVLDGNFLNTLPLTIDRLTDEEFVNLFAINEADQLSVEWVKRYELFKTNLLAIDFSNLNRLLTDLKELFEQSIVNPLRKESTNRFIYCTVSYILICFDFLLKDLLTLEEIDRKNRISEGLKFGNLGRSGIERTLDVAIRISKQSMNVRSNFLKLYESLSVDILSEFFSKQNNSDKIFEQAIKFDALAYSKQFLAPSKIDPELKGILSVFLDYHGVERNSFF